MNRDVMWAVAMKDMRAVTANLQVWLPMAIVPVMLGVILPAMLIGLVLYSSGQAPDQLQQMVRMLERLPAGEIRSRLEAFPVMEQRLAYLTANYMLAPLFLLVPLMTASVISADSFAGEKERGTLESLLFTPTDLLSLFGGKVLSAFLPALTLSMLTFALFAAVVNALAWPVFGGLFFPTGNWLPLMVLVIPMASLLAILVNVIISARVATFQAAYQLGGLVVLPVVALVFSQVTGALILDVSIMLGLGLALALANWGLLRLALRRLDRPHLFESQIR